MHPAKGQSLLTIAYGALGPNAARVTTTIGTGQTQKSELTFKYQKGRFLGTAIKGSCASCSGPVGDHV